jgi:hypothetical protein
MSAAWNGTFQFPGAEFDFRTYRQALHFELRLNCGSLSGIRAPSFCDNLMQISFCCPSCGKHSRSQSCGSERTVRCTECDWNRAAAEDDLTEEEPRVCLVCGNPDLWRQKDFSQRLGVLIVILGAVLSSIAWAWHMPLTALGTLMVFALVDLVLFLVMPDVLVCYRCRTRHSGVGAVSGHESFNHELAERYRQEQLRMNQTG